MKRDKLKNSIIEQLKKMPIVQIACEKIGIGRATYYRWRKESKKFTEETDAAIAEGLLLINDMAESQLLSAIRDKNMTAIIFWLRNHHQSYTNRMELTAHLNQIDEKLTPEQEKIVKKALRLASLTNQDINASNNNEEENTSK